MSGTGCNHRLGPSTICRRTCAGGEAAHFRLDTDGNSADDTFMASTSTDVEFSISGANADMGGSAVFNSSSSLIQHDWSADLSQESLTLAQWCKVGCWYSCLELASHRELNTDSQGYLIDDNEPDGNWTFRSGNRTVDGNWQVLNDLGVGLGRWEHLAITNKSATETKKLFINGVLAAEAPE